MSADAVPPDDLLAADLLADWRAIWLSEATALALDPEWREVAGRAASPPSALWAVLWPTLWAALACAACDGGGLARPAGSGPAPGTTAAGVAPGPGGDLEGRVAELRPSRP